MNRGFVHYFSKGMRTAAKLLLKGGKYVRYYIYYFASLLGSALPCVGAIFPVADVRHAKIAIDEDELTVLRAYGGIESGHSFGTTVLTFLIKFLVLTGGLVAIGIVGFLLSLLGAFIGDCVEISNKTVLPVVFALPACVAALAYAVAVWLLSAPSSYLLDTDAKAGVSDILSASVETMRRDGKGTFFLNAFVPYLIKIAYLALAAGILFLFSDISSTTARSVLCVVWLILAAAVYIVFAPVFTMAMRIANVQLFRDIALEPDVLNNRTKGLFIKRCRVDNPLSAKGRDADLESMFENTSTTPVDPPDTRYVPPTDWAEKMKVFDPAAEDGAPAQTAQEEAPAGESRAADGGAREERAQQTNEAGEQE